MLSSEVLASTRELLAELNRLAPSNLKSDHALCARIPDMRHTVVGVAKQEVWRELEVLGAE